MLPDIIKSWVDSYVNLANARVLDFGCGHGITALAMAMRFNARVLGVDIMPDPAECLPRAHAELGIGALPENLELRRIEPGEDFREGDQFDLIYSWSAFEHVSQDIFDRVLGQIKSRLSQNGCFFLQIAPLYYSAEGSHLFHRIPEPWGHILNQESIYFRKLSESCESDEEVAALWSCFQHLNRLTASDLAQRLHRHGFEIIREHKTQDQYHPHAGLETVIHPDVLKTNQVVFLARHVSC
ncbi:MAG: class I SAM-dependent methyltransferase [Syntrophobacteraceae bacterium]|jgi:cyclopropane fatty-acyl-phospholipid synthase-like methyltransferase